MKRLTITLLIILLGGCAASETPAPIRLVYSGLDYQIPPNPVALGSMGGEENLLAASYSEEVAQDYLAFTRETSLVTGGCSYPEFVETVQRKTDEQTCSADALAAFRHVFMEDARYGVWPGNAHDHYYFETKQGSFVFTVLGEDELVKVDSDFLGAEELREVIEPQLASG